MSKIETFRKKLKNEAGYSNADIEVVIHLAREIFGDSEALFEIVEKEVKRWKHVAGEAQKDLKEGLDVAYVKGVEDKKTQGKGLSREDIAEIVKKWCANLDNDDRRSILVDALLQAGGIGAKEMGVMDITQIIVRHTCENHWYPSSDNACIKLAQALHSALYSKGEPFASPLPVSTLPGGKPTDNTCGKGEVVPEKPQEKPWPNCSKDCKVVKELGAGECENVCPDKFKPQEKYCQCIPSTYESFTGIRCSYCLKPKEKVGKEYYGDRECCGVQIPYGIRYCPKCGEDDKLKKVEKIMPLLATGIETNTYFDLRVKMNEVIIQVNELAERLNSLLP